MCQLQIFPVLRTLGFVFWSSLPLIGLLFWLGSGLVGDQILSRAYSHKKYLQADTQLARQIMKKIVAIEVKVLQEEGISLVNVKTNHSPLKTMTFEFPITEPDQLEANLSRELGLSRERVTELTRYHN
ncbi:MULTISPECIES: hypothetical protein [Fischerella]|uniref:Uncharacterized protein n=1 Tax=Fischerella muscicola CCMEE 5323 TaxID=2019572 RepID=A0A2N6K1P7_FISMU|nr:MULTISPECIES: hypothetical protein [Fischerella]MBD2434521.1 hypothetical protein [Fischerella sp. FACHB-380]PLZ88557.1 hypothetical protein CEN44_15025 [Fischerella muscicola CCMEE 5323]